MPHTDAHRADGVEIDRGFFGAGDGGNGEGEADHPDAALKPECDSRHGKNRGGAPRPSYCAWIVKLTGVLSEMPEPDGPTHSSMVAPLASAVGGTAYVGSVEVTLVKTLVPLT